MVLAEKCRFESILGGFEYLQGASVELTERVLPANHVNGCSLLRSGFRQNQSARRKVESSKPDFSLDGRRWHFPLQTSRYHQMKDHEKIVFEAEYDLLAQPPQVLNPFVHQ